MQSTQEPTAEPMWWQNIDEKEFSWRHPAKFNIGLAVLEDKAEDDTAILETGARELVVTFG